MNPFSIRRLILALSVALVAGLGVWTCNVSDGKNLLSVDLSDSLHTYDSILIVVRTPGGADYAKKLIKKEDYGPVKDGRFQAIVDLGDTPPATYDILITTYGGGKKNEYIVAVKAGEIKKPEPYIDTAKPKPTSVEMETASPQVLAAHGATLRLVAHVLPMGADPSLLWESGNLAVASVDTDGTVHPGLVGETDLAVRSKADTTLEATVHVKVILPPHLDSLSLTPDSAKLYVGGETLKLFPHVVPEDGAVSLEYSTSDKTIAKVSGGVVTAVDTGLAIITVRPLGDSVLSATCEVHVVKDVPRLDAGGDRKCRKGDTLTFPIHVTQAYGGIAALRWNLDGDGTWDDSVTDSSASPSHIYDGKDTLVTVSFYVRDTEGNKMTVTHKVHVGSFAPLVDITFPASRDTLVNTPSVTVHYEADGVKKTKDFTLAEGPNSLVVSESNAYGTGNDTVKVTLDTQAPLVKITSPADSLLTNKDSVAVRWTADGVEQSKGKVEDLRGKQGAIVITREAVDAAGNKGSASVTVVRDTVPPGAPVISGPAFSAGSPTWTWTSVEDKATYTYRLMKSGSITPVDSGITLALAYSPSSVTEGSYTLSVKAVDSAGNVGIEKSRAVYVDLIDPVVAITGPSSPGRVTSVNPTLTGTASDNKALKSLVYSIQGGGGGNVTISAGSWALPDLAVPESTHAVTVTATDSAGRTASAQIAITKLPNMVFVRKTAVGNGSGTSWENAYTELWQVLDSTKTYSAGTQIWVTEGEYASIGDRGAFVGKPDLGIFGGFDPMGTGASLKDRDTTQSNSILRAGFETKNNSILDGFTMNGFATDGRTTHLTYGLTGGNGNKVEIRNCVITGFESQPAYFDGGGTLILKSTVINANANAEYGAIYVGTGPTMNVQMFNCSITGNTWNSGAGLNIGGANVTIRNSVFRGNGASFTGGSPFQIYLGGGSLDISGSIIEGGFGNGVDGKSSGTIYDSGSNKDQNGNSISYP